MSRLDLPSAMSRRTSFSGEEDELRLRPYLTDAQTGVGPRAIGEPEVDQCDVRLELLRARNRFDHRSRLADDSHVGLVVQQRREAVRHHQVVLDDQDSDLALDHCTDGTQNSTFVPFPGSLVTSHQPPASSARSLSANRPRCPGRWSRSLTTNPRPSSTTSPWMPPSRSLTQMRTRVAAACFSTLVRASATCLKMIDLIS